MTLTNEDLLALADRLEAPAYWFSGSDEGHEGENAVPHEAAAALRAIVAERDALRAALEEIVDGLKGIARDIQIGPDDEGRDIYEMALVIRDDARAALKGDSDE